MMRGRPACRLYLYIYIYKEQIVLLFEMKLYSSIGGKTSSDTLCFASSPAQFSLALPLLCI